MTSQTITESITQTTVGFLEDWKGGDHRHLDESAREQVGRYIEAIVKHDPLIGSLSAGAQLAYAAMLWTTFRETYDDFRGPFMKSAAEDIRRAMARL